MTLGVSVGLGGGRGAQLAGRERHGATPSFLAPGNGPAGTGGSPLARLVTQVLLGTVPGTADGKDWQAARRYLRVRLAGHAAAAGLGTLLPLLQDWGFLAVADPERLLPLMDVTRGGLRETARVYRRAWQQLGADAEVNAACLAETARALGVPQGGAASGAPGPSPRSAYRTVLTARRADDSLLTMPGHRGVVYEVSCAATLDGRPLAATAGHDGTVRLWDLRAGVQMGEPWTVADGWLGDAEFGTAPDGRLLLVTCGEDRKIRLWDPLAASPVGEPLAGHTDGVASATFGTVRGEGGGGGRLLLASAGFDDTLRIWDALAGVPVGEPIAHTDAVNSVKFTTVGDGGRLLLASGGKDRMVRLWDPLTGAAAREPLAGHESSVYIVAFGTTADGRQLLASGSGDETIRLWDPLAGVPWGDPIRVPGSGGVPALVFGTGPDGRLVLASSGVSDCVIRVWDPLTGAPIVAPLTSPSSIYSLAFFPGRDGEPLLVSACNDGTVRLWDPFATQAACPPARHARWVSSVAFAPRPGQQPLLVTTGDTGAEVWDPDGDADRTPLAGYSSMAGAVAVTALPGGGLLAATGGTDKTIRLWDPATGGSARALAAGFAGRVRAAAFGTVKGDGEAGGGRLLLLAAAGDDGVIRIWDPVTGQPIGEPLTGHTSWIGALAFTTVEGDGEAGGGQVLLASAGGDHTVRLWDPVVGTLAAEPLVGHQGAVQALAFGAGPAGQLVLASAGDDMTVRLWDPLAGVPVGVPLTGHTGWIHAATFMAAPDGRDLLATGGHDQVIRVWDLAAGACLLAFRRGSAVRALAAAGLTLAIGDDEGLAVIDLDPLALVRPRRVA